LIIFKNSRAPKKHRAGHRKGGGRPFFTFFGKKTPQTQNRPQKSGQFSGSFFGRFSKKFTKISKTFFPTNFITKGNAFCMGVTLLPEGPVYFKEF